VKLSTLFFVNTHTLMFAHQQLGRRSTDQSLIINMFGYQQCTGSLHGIQGLDLAYFTQQKHKPTVPRPKRRDIILWQ